MSYVDEIEAGIARQPDLADYRINLGAGRGVGVGIRDNDVGSVYSPLSFSDTIGGGFLVQWRDGRISRGNLDGNSLDHLDQVLDLARSAAYHDPDAAQFLGPQQVHPVELSSPDVAPLFGERAGFLLEVVGALQNIGGRYEAHTLNGGVSAGISESWLRTSRGLKLHATGTSFGYSAAFDGIIGDGFRHRTLIELPEITEQTERIGNYLRQLRNVASAPPAGRRLIVLHPNVAYALFDFFVWGNMGGSGVYHGQSAWNAQDFATRRQVLREDWAVHVEPWEPLGPGSFGWTAEGLPSAPMTYIASGRLQSPVLDLKYARRLDLPPLTPPGSEHSVRLEAGDEEQADALLGSVADGVLVLSVLGLHTQDRTSGDYSLSAPQALLVRDGEMLGRVKATFSGNFFDHLRDDALRLVRFPGQHSPGFAYPGSVTFEPI